MTVEFIPGGIDRVIVNDHTGLIVETDAIKFKIGDIFFTIKPDKDGITLQKVSDVDPLNEPVIISPIHTNKIKIK